MRTALANPISKKKLLDAAEQLMLTKGFEATSVEEICEKARLTKGSFFHYFESKEELGKDVLNRFVAAMSQCFQQAPFRKESDPLKRVYGYLDFAIQISRDPKAPQGCLLGIFSQELSDCCPQIRSLCAKHFSQWTEELRTDLAQAKAKYAPKRTLDPHSLAEHIIAVMEGSLVLARANKDRRVIEQGLKHLKQYLKSLFQR